MASAEDKKLEELLDDAERQASSNWEMEFVAGIKVRYKQYGDRTVLSEKQLSRLRSIAGDD
ncbi:hypothetical protein [Methylovulum miyakonense]|uniref:hypothetical protein n=1 Tax=Methylovulum miyakonense TaxID=645578 RepID=UPI0003795B09|nr:hypothetical protein [Methylovulum miyakonense]